jgi:WD40 repeat protein
LSLYIHNAQADKTAIKNKNGYFQQIELEDSAQPTTTQAFSPDKKLLAAYRNINKKRSTLKIWDTKTGKLLHSTYIGGRKGYEDRTAQNTIRFSPDSKMLFLTGNVGSFIAWDFTKNKHTSAICKSEYPSILGITQNNQWIEVEDWSSTVRACSTKNTKEYFLRSTGGRIPKNTKASKPPAFNFKPFSLSINTQLISLKGNQLTRYSDDLKHIIWQKKVNKNLFPRPAKNQFYNLQYKWRFSADKKRIIGYLSEYAIQVFNAKTGEYLYGYILAGQKILTEDNFTGSWLANDWLVFSSDKFNRKAYTGKISLFNMKTAKVEQTIYGNTSIHVVTSPDGKLLYTYIPNKKIILYRLFER